MLNTIKLNKVFNYVIDTLDGRCIMMTENNINAKHLYVKLVDEYFSSEYLKNLVLFFQQENEIDIVRYRMSVLRSE